MWICDYIRKIQDFSSKASFLFFDSLKVVNPVFVFLFSYNRVQELAQNLKTAGLESKE